MINCQQLLSFNVITTLVYKWSLYYYCC